MISLFKNNHAVGIAAVLLSIMGLGIALYFFAPVTEPVAEYPAGGALLHWKKGFFTPFPWAEHVVVIVLVLIQAFYFNFIISKNTVLYKSTFLPALFFSYFCLFFPQQLLITPQLAAHFFMILAIGNIFIIQAREKAFVPIFNSGVFLGCSILFIPQTLIFIPLFLLGILLFKSSYPRDFFQFLLGVCLPAYFTGAVLYLTDRFYYVQEFFSKKLFDLDFSGFPKNEIFLIFSGFLVLILLITFIRLQQNFFKNTIKTRKYQQFMLVYFLFTILLVLFGNQPISQNFTYLAAPVSIFLSYYFLPNRRLWLQDIVLLLFMGAIVAHHLFWLD